MAATQTICQVIVLEDDYEISSKLVPILLTGSGVFMKLPVKLVDSWFRYYSLAVVSGCEISCEIS